MGTTRGAHHRCERDSSIALVYHLLDRTRKSHTLTLIEKRKAVSNVRPSVRESHRCSSFSHESDQWTSFVPALDKKRRHRRGKI